MEVANSVGRAPAGRGGQAPDAGAERIIGAYRLGPRLGAGSEGELFAATALGAGRVDQTAFALKLFHALSAATETRVRREYERLSGLDHPGIVKPVDLGRAADGRLYLVTELVEGASIAALAERRDRDREEGQREGKQEEKQEAVDHGPTAAVEGFVRVARDVTDALAYLHGRGVIHGDLSPANVRLTPATGAPGVLRAVLVDFGALGGGGLGIGRGSASTGGASGTLGFAAPEALVGSVGPASDLFSLGATLFFAWTGQAPFGVGAPSLQRLLSSSATVPPLASLRAGLPAGWDKLLGDLLARDPGQRPSSARVVLKRIDDLATAALRRIDESAVLPPFPAGDPLAGAFVGRRRERTRIADLVDALEAGGADRERPGAAGVGVAVIAVAGAEGMGRRTLIRAALREAALRRLSRRGASLEIFEGSVSELEAFLDARPEPPEPAPAEPAARWSSVESSDPVRGEERRFVRIADRLDARVASLPLAVVLDPGAESSSLARVLAGGPASRRWLVVLPTVAPLGAFAGLDLVLGPLGLPDAQALLTHATDGEAPSELAERLLRLSGGSPAVLAAVARQWIVASRAGDLRLPSEAGAGLDGLLARSFSGLPTDVRQTVARVFLSQGDLAGAAGDVAIAALDGARAAGWLVDGVEPPRLPSNAHARAVEAALGEPDLRPLALDIVGRAAGQTVPGRSDTESARRASCLRALGRREEAARAFRLAAASAVAGQNLHSERAVAWLEEALQLDPAELPADACAFLVAALAVQGHTGRALARLDATLARGQLSADDRLRLRERKAWLLARAGQPADGFEELSLAWAGTAGDPAITSATARLVRARLARLLLGLGRFDEASRLATETLEAEFGAESGSDLGSARDRPGLALETLGETLILAEAYAGNLAAARTRHRQFCAEHTGFPAARAAYLGAFIEHLAGALDEAIARYRLALALSERLDDPHTRAAIALNLGALAAEAGRYEEALATQDRAIRELGRLGATLELATALFNAAMLLVELGDLPAAERMLERLRHASGARLLSSTAASVAYVEAELAARRGDPEVALRAFARVAEIPGAGPQLGRAARLAYAEQLARHQRLAEAWEQLDALQPAGAPPAVPGLDTADLELACARVSLAGPAAEVDLAAGLTSVARLERCAELAERSGRKPLAWRLALSAARLLHRAGHTARAQPLLARARGSFEEVRMSVPADHRAGFESDRDAHFLIELGRAARAASPGPAGAPAPVDGTRGAADTAPRPAPEHGDGRLRRLLRINKRLNSELRLPRLLELIMDTVIELTEAERGFVLLEDDQGELVVKVARNIGEQTLEAESFELSQSIARQAATGGQPIVTVDAGMDPRFREAVSVSDLHLRSVMAVPLQIKGRAVGTIYVDNRLRKGAFGEADVELVLDFAEQAAIAIENARLMTELRRRERQIEVLNRRLERDLVARKEELSGMKVELRESREALAIRYDYKNIVGRTPRMLELFRLLDRLTDTTLPVVIQGESGTGKELVARALHFNGARKHRAFVSENCAAIPETLLETTLFGSVKGAYTGADHDTRGLFEVADGGTLFLDEVGEMSPSMQGKLLRVLQTGELRRVGSERSHKVDVRIIAATNRDLSRMVEEGRFRQDLFFRLSVARIGLPPLRERREDIPAMVEHILASQVSSQAQSRAQPGAPPRVARGIEPAALSRLMAYRWPGNVRELENELMRAAAMSHESIASADLSPHIGGDETGGLTPEDHPDNLALRPRVERLERSLLREALGRHAGNQTRAAEALGLSRFGLQKKLKRYHMG